jgi:N-acetylglucosamine-6-phosphate deacetylase
VLLVRAELVVVGDRVVAEAEVVVDDLGLVAEVRPATGPPDHHCLVPGLVDLQVNGHDDVDVATADGDGWDRLSHLLTDQGVTAWCPTLVTDTLPATAAALTRIAAAADRADGPEILGAHLEGPFLGGRPGAHDPALIGRVDPAWLASLPDVVAIVTGAPECPGAPALWRWAVEREVVASVGHSDTDTDGARAAFEAGARMVTHLFNAMSGTDHRRPGVATAALLDDRVTVGLIADGVHVHPDLVRLAFRVKGPDRVALVTDAVAWRDRPPGAPLALDAGAPRRPDGTLAGSALTLDRAVANVVAWGIPLADAVRAASTTPADLLDRPDLGRITPGARADLTALDADGRSCATWLAGRSVPR